MPRVVIPLQVMSSEGGGDDEVTWTSGDAGNGHYFDNTSESVLLLMKNTDGSQRTATVVSVADEYGRTGDKTVTCSATTGHSVYGPFPANLFNQRGASDLGKVFVDLGNATGVSFAAVKFDPAK